MSFRQVFVHKGQKIKIKNHNLCIIKNNHQEVFIPLEDIFIVLIEDPNILLTTRFITTCTKNKITIVLCDEKYIPESIINGFNSNYRQQIVLHQQLKLPQVTKETLWQQLIKIKLTNQMYVLKYTSNIEKDIELLTTYARDVKNNDIDNREGIAAKVFFKSIYGTEFIRFYHDGINSALNYGYKIIVSAITRELISYGVDPKFGIWHDSKTNNYNLAYDLVEIFRPIIDYYVYENKHLIQDKLSLHIRRDLINILNTRMELNKKMQTLQFCIGEVVKSYIRVIEGKSDTLKYPLIIKTDFITHE